MRGGAGEIDAVGFAGGEERQFASRVLAAEIAGVESGFVDLIIVDVAQNAAPAKPRDRRPRVRTRSLAFQHHFLGSHNRRGGRGGGGGNRGWRQTTEMRRFEGID